jgi:putative addiction module killer protein
MLDARAAARMTRVVGNLGRGLRPDVEPVGHGVFESKVHFGPGYRLYFRLDGDEVIILVGGGNKASQPADISDVQESWADYKAPKKRTME